MLHHPAQKVGVDDVARSVSAGREFVRVGQADGAQAVARGEGGFESGIAGRGRVGGVGAVGEAEGRGARLGGDTTNGHNLR